MKKMKNGAEALIAFLESKKIKTIAGIPGGYNLPIYDALKGSSIEHVLVRHEQAAAFFAQGQARTSGKPAICLATSGPGATNLLTAIGDAFMDSIPLIAITGQVSQELIGTRAFQEVDICKMADPVCKKTYQPHSAKQLIIDLNEAWALTQSGRPGPVLIDIPKDVQLDTFDEKIETETACPEEIGLDKNSLEQVLRSLREAQNPIIYLGGGVNSPRIAKAFSHALQMFLKCFDIPVANTLMAKGILPAEHSNLLGMLGMHGEIATNKAMQNSDRILCIGARFDDRATGKLQEFAPRAKITFINKDASENNRLVSNELFIQADALEFIYGLIDVYIDNGLEGDPRQTFQQVTYDKWWNEIRAIAIEYPSSRQIEQDQNMKGPAHLMEALAKSLPVDIRICTDVGQHQMWTAQYFAISNPGHFYTSGGMGTMGFGLPVALGVASESKEPVVLISGDGSIQMNIQELATLAELNLNIKIIVLKNKQLGLVHQQQELFFEGSYSASCFDRQPNLAKIAEGYGIKAQTITWNEDCAEAQISEFLKGGGPRLLQLEIPENWLVLPMVPPGRGLNSSLLPKSFSKGVKV